LNLAPPGHVTPIFANRQLSIDAKKVEIGAKKYVSLFFSMGEKFRRESPPYDSKSAIEINGEADH
jgi:hypothetical protein